MRTILAALLASIAAATAPVAQANPLMPAIEAAVDHMETITGRPVAVLQRNDHDPAEFWYQATMALCEATGDNWCEEDVRRLTDTTNQLGWARVLTYTGDDGTTRTACALLPPRPGVYAGYAASGIAGGGTFFPEDLPSDDEMEAYLWLLHLSACQNEVGNDQERERADAFATLGLTLVEGSAVFATGLDVSPSRLFNAYRNPETTRWATNVGERLLLEDWKTTITAQLREQRCNAIMVASDDLNTDYIDFATGFSSSNTCDDEDEGYRAAQVTDENLWLWASPSHDFGLTLPPTPHTPFAMFANPTEGWRYVWTTANQLAQ